MASPSTITIDASGSSGIDFEAFIRGGFLADVTGGGFPVFDNGSAFSGKEMFVGFGTDADSKYVFAQGDIEYAFATHTVHGTIETIEYGTRGSGSFDADGHFAGGNAELLITGLDLFNAATPEAEVEADGAVHNFAVAQMSGAHAPVDALSVYADALDQYAQHFIGSAGDDTFTGAAFKDLIEAGGGNDEIGGGDGKDQLFGRAGDDTLVGGLGADQLKGGSGADTFVFLVGPESTMKSAGRDLIRDFDSLEQDKIDLSALGPGLSFVGKESFSGEAGEVRTFKKHGDTYLSADLDGNEKADFAIRLDGSFKLHDSDLILAV